MAMCGNCGAQVNDGAGVCPSCGAAQAVQTSGNDAQDNKVMAILAYIIFLVPLLAAKDSPFARYHTNQGLVLFICAFAAGIVLGILIFIIPFLALISWILNLGVLALMIIGIINASKGEMKPLPLIGSIQILK